MKLALFPRNDHFFDLFCQSAMMVREGAEHLLQMMRDFTDVPDKAAELKKIESRGDHVTHEIIEHLHASFITPFDREDIYALARNLDQCLDEIEGVGSRMLLFNVQQPTQECIALTEIISNAATHVETAVKELKGFRDTRNILGQVRHLEHEADQISRRMTASLFHNGNGDVVNLIKWKEIYSRLEHTADRMEDVANLIEDILVKQQ